MDTCCNTSSSCGSKARLPIVLGVLAIATAVPAWILPARASSDASATATAAAVLGRQGVQPEQITGLVVATWDDTLSAAKRFEVKKVGDRWTILSNHGYPADGNTRVTKTAAGILGVTRGRLVTARPEEHQTLGVIDPLEHDATVKTGFGKRVTMTDNTGAMALDLIIGNRAEQGDGMYYVREAGKAEVFTAKVESDITTRFVDWVETDPFKLKKDDIRGVATVEYNLDIDKGKIEPGPQTRITRTGTAADWQSQQVPEDKRVAKSAVDKIVDELALLRLQGVRPFDLRWLQGRGFYLLDQPQAFQLPGALTVTLQNKPFALFGTEGRLDVTTKDGLRYSFLFGKVALGDDQDKDADSKEPEKKEGDKKDAASTSNNRYLAVFVTYDASLDEDAKAEAAAAAEKKDGDKKDEKPAKKKITGKERAEKAQARYQQFFYVISDANFKNLLPEKGKLWEDKPKEPMAGNTGKTNKQWLDDNGKVPGVTVLPSGLQYQVLKSGAEGGAKPTASDKVQVAYKGTLLDGTQFDANDSMEFQVTGVIKGWTEALHLMKPGDQWKLFIPPELGYGEAGSPPKIPANSILTFEVELKQIVK